MNKAVRLFLFSILFLAAFASCRKETPQWEISLPSTPILTGTVGWGVVNTPYLKITPQPADDHFVVTTLREGDIVKIDSVHYLKDERGRAVTVWYRVSWENLHGWVRDVYLDTYDTREKALTGSKMLLSGDTAQ